MNQSHESEQRNCSCMGKNMDRLLQPAVLMCLLNHDMHGFLLLQYLSESPMFCGDYPDPTGLYRYLKKMEQNGLLTSYKKEQDGAPAKTVYHITEQGVHCLKKWEETLSEYEHRLHCFCACLCRKLAAYDAE